MKKKTGENEKKKAFHARGRIQMPSLTWMEEHG